MRYIFAIIGAAAITLALFVMMQSLVAMTEAGLDEKSDQRVIEFVRLKHESSMRTKKRTLPKRKSVSKQPEPPALNLSKSHSAPIGTPITVNAPSVPIIQHNVNLTGGPSLGAAPVSDAGLVPLVRIQPLYPREAAERRIEGWVKLRFTISTTGTVKNAQVIESQPVRIFDRAALRAIKKWKYKPRVVNGKPLATPNLEVKLKFELDE